MRRARKISILFAFGLLAGFFFWIFRENDPMHKGKRLSQHLANIKTGGISYGMSVSNNELKEPIVPFLSQTRVHAEEREAILQLGPKAIPLLVNMLNSRESRLVKLWYDVVEKLKLPERFNRKPSNSTFGRKLQALAAFEILGTNATPAIERLIPMLAHPDEILYGIMAIQLIHPIEEEYVLCLTNVFSTYQSRSKGRPELLLQAAMLSLGSFGSTASEAIPYLMAELSSTNRQNQAAAAVALARIGAPSENVVPLLIKTLPVSDPTRPPGGSFPPANPWEYSPSPLLMKLWALEKYGAEAEAALPSLMRIQEFKNISYQITAKRVAATIKRKSNIQD